MTEPVATTEQGQVRGKIETNYYGETFYSFYGIPYAKAPAGNLRFKVRSIYKDRILHKISILFLIIGIY